MQKSSLAELCLHLLFSLLQLILHLENSSVELRATAISLRAANSSADRRITAPAGSIIRLCST